MEWSMTSYNLLLLNQQYLVDIGSFAIVSSYLKSLNRQKWFFKLWHKLWLLELHYHPEPRHEDLHRPQYHWHHLVNLFLLLKSCILWIIPTAFDCYLLDQSTNLNNWSLNFVEWEFYAWFLTHQPSLRRYQCSIQVGNLNCLKLMLIQVKGFCFVEQAFSLKTILWFII